MKCFLLTVSVIAIVGLSSACDSNTPPVQASNPFPSDGAIAQDTSLVLTWDCYDPDGEAVLSFDIFLDAAPDPAEKVSLTTDYYYQVHSLQFATTYYWKVVASDGKESTHGPVWRFTTRTN